MQDDKHVGRVETPQTPGYWEERYQRGEDQWDKGEPSPGLVDFLANLDPDLKRGRVFQAGCGRGHDAREWARHGFEVLATDIAPSAIRGAQEAGPALPGLRFEQADYFQPRPEWTGAFDWVFEHTFFCAIEPRLRNAYGEIVRKLLRPGGHFLAVFYHIQPESGPPFGTTREELECRFLPHFELLQDRVPRSYPNRTGLELLWWLRKK